MVMTAAHCERVADEKIRTENGETWFLSYYVQVFQGDNGEYYGLRVEKRTPEGELDEYEETGGLTECRDEIFSMANAFARGTVTPVTLLEMVDDWMSDF